MKRQRENKSTRRISITEESQDTYLQLVQQSDLDFNQIGAPTHSSSEIPTRVQP